MTNAPLRLVVLGDSLAYGTGAQRPEDSLGPRLVAALAAEGLEVGLDVVAVPGATSTDLAAQVRRAVAGRPDLALVVIGANDLARFAPPAPAAEALGRAVGELRTAGAEVMVVTAPDMSAVPWVPAQARALIRLACTQFRQMQAAAVAGAGGVVLPVAAELSRLMAADVRLFSGDRFHPSSAGYALIADNVAPHVVAAARYRASRAA